MAMYIVRIHIKATTHAYWKLTEYAVNIMHTHDAQKRARTPTHKLPIVANSYGYHWFSVNRTHFYTSVVVCTRRLSLGRHLYL